MCTVCSYPVQPAPVVIERQRNGMRNTRTGGYTIETAKTSYNSASRTLKRPAVAQTLCDSLPILGICRPPQERKKNAVVI